MSAKLAHLIGIPVVGLHQGQRTYAPHQQAGHMTAADQIVRNVKKVLAKGGRPHMTVEFMRRSGVKQKPIEGVSILYSFDNKDAKSRRTTQYFEMLANRGIYKDGWLATTRHGRLPWQTAGGGGGEFDKDPWELYKFAEDFSQANNLAAKYPDKAKALQAAFIVEAKKYNVLPLDDRMSERFDATLRPNPLAGLKKFSYGPGVSGISEFAVLNTHNVPFAVTADVEVGDAGAEACSQRLAASPRDGRSM